MKKNLFIPVLFLLFLTTAPVTASSNTGPMTCMQVKIPLIQTYSNDTEYRFKYENGICWKRLWSNTENRWIDPKWTPV